MQCSCCGNVWCNSRVHTPSWCQSPERGGGWEGKGGEGGEGGMLVFWHACDNIVAMVTCSNPKTMATTAKEMTAIAKALVDLEGLEQPCVWGRGGEVHREIITWHSPLRLTIAVVLKEMLRVVLVKVVQLSVLGPHSAQAGGMPWLSSMAEGLREIQSEALLKPQHLSYYRIE